MVSHQHACDVVEIYELCARYNYTVDHEQYQEWADTFVPEGEFIGIIGRFKVHAELDKFIASMQALAKSIPSPRHYVTNILPVIKNDEATCTSFLLVTGISKEGFRVAFAGEYHDKLERRDGRWLFLERIVKPDALASNALPPDAGADVISEPI